MCAVFVGAGGALRLSRPACVPNGSLVGRNVRAAFFWLLFFAVQRKVTRYARNALASRCRTHHQMLYPGIRTHFVAGRGQLAEPHHVLLGSQVKVLKSASGYLAVVTPRCGTANFNYRLVQTGLPEVNKARPCIKRIATADFPHFILSVRQWVTPAHGSGRRSEAERRSRK